METNERRQLHDEIVDGKVDIESVPMSKLSDFEVDFDENYSPEPDFFFKVKAEIRRRNAVKRRKANFNRDFF